MKRAFLITLLGFSSLGGAAASAGLKPSGLQPDSSKVSLPHSSDKQLLPAGWSFLNDPSPLFPHPEKALEQKQGVKGANMASGRPVTEEGSVVTKSVPTIPGATGLWLPLGELTPVAAFRNSGNILIVAAGRHVLDTAGLSQVGPFTSVSSRLLPDVTVITVGLADERTPVLRPVGAGWTISVAPDVKPQEDMVLRQDRNTLTFTSPVEEGVPQVVALADPASGRRLLLGMTRSGRIQKSMRRLGTGFAVRSSLVGVVIAADSDTIELRQTDGKLVLDSAGPNSFPLIASGRLQPYGSSLSGVSLTAGSPEELREALRRETVSAALASSGDRFDARMRVAQAAARSGNGPLLSEVMQVALQDWPEGLEKPAARRLQQISAVLNDRAGFSSLAEDGGNTPEDQLWRGMMRMISSPASRAGQMVSGSEGNDRSQTADLVAKGLPVLQAYAEPLRNRLMPVASEWVARYGNDSATKILEQLPDTGQTTLAKALLAGRRNTPGADKRLSDLAHDPSPLVWPVAREAFLKLALEKKTLPAQAVADQIDGILPALRIAKREKGGRLLQIDALIKAANFAAAGAAVQEWIHRYPDDVDAIRSQKTTILNQMAQSASGNERQNRDEIVFLKETLAQNSEDFSQQDILEALAHRYEAMGLPDQERETLRRLLTTQDGPAATQVRIRLASLELEMGDLKAARDDLAAFSEGSPDAALALPGANSGQAVDVALLRARIALAEHHSDEAAGELATIRDPRAWTLRAQMAEKSGEWSRAVEALLPMLDSLPEPGKSQDASLSPDQQSLVLRVGGDASRAQDQQTLDKLSARFGTQMKNTPSAGVFRLLTGHEEKVATPVSAGG